VKDDVLPTITDSN